MVTRRRFTLRSSDSELAALRVNLDYWPQLRELLKGLEYLEIETKNSAIPILGVPRVAVRRTTRQQGIGWAFIAETIRRSRAHTLIALDSPSEPIAKLGALAPEVSQLLIAHGSLRRETLIRYHQFLRTKHKSRQFFVWGKHDEELVKDLFGPEVDCIPVGSIKNALYQRRQPNGQKLHEIVLVSKFAGRAKEASGLLHPSRARVINLLTDHLRRYCITKRVAIHVALTAPRLGELPLTHWEEERHYFAEIFSGVKLTFSEPTREFSTYYACDSGDVTVGIPSGSLTESFGRGNKVLMLAQLLHTGDRYGFPFPGPWLTHEPTYGEFESSLSQIRNMSRAQFAIEADNARSLVLENPNSDKAARLVREAVQLKMALS